MRANLFGECQQYPTAIAAWQPAPALFEGGACGAHGHIDILRPAFRDPSDECLRGRIDRVEIAAGYRRHTTTINQQVMLLWRCDFSVRFL